MYHLFGGVACFYASGGANDYVGKFNSLGDAEEAAQKEYNGSKLAWWCIADLNMKIVTKSDEQPYSYDDGIAHNRALDSG